MCGRYTVIDDDDIAELRQIIPGFRGHINAGQLAEPHTVFPGGTAPILTQHGDFMFAGWGFSKWNAGGVVYNARSESIADSAFFAPHLPFGRCIAPAREYFEWQMDPEDSKKKIRHRIWSPDGKPLWMGALMRPHEGKFEYTVITRAASRRISHIHHRMPLIFTSADAAAWLSGSFDASLLTRGVNELAYEPQAGVL